MFKIDFQHPSYIYFAGIGGISMSGLAELLADAGFKVSGSDWNHSETTERLEKKGIRINYGQQRYENITDDIDCVVFTSAVHKDNPEYVAVMEKKIPHLSRGELMGQLMRNYRTPIAVSGTHGKTTTTSMISEILLEAKLDPTLSIGGMYKNAGGNFRIGAHEYFVAEACEYTNSFLDFFPKIGIILNIEEDHLDFFKDLADIRRSFRKFAELLPADGLLVINGEIPGYREISDGLPCRVLTYSTKETCFDGARPDYYAAAIDLSPVSLATGNRPKSASFLLTDAKDQKMPVDLSVPGIHNISNALASFACADSLGIDRSIICQALSNFTGTDRRFEYKGERNGVTIIDDYAHHPTEITATLTAARKIPCETLWCVFQPHTYSRTKALLSDFAKALALADKVVLAPIYAARETDTLGISSADLMREITSLGVDCHTFDTFSEIEIFLSEKCINGDVLITMGAGNVYEIGDSLLKK